MISLGLVLLVALAGALSGAADKLPTDSLVAEAARPEVFYGNPAACDSLIGLLAGNDGEHTGELLGMLETPWAAYYAVIRRALEKIGGPAREAVLERLADGKMDHDSALLLTILEKLGDKSAEKILPRFLQSAQPEVVIPAARCLAVFGPSAESRDLLASLLADSIPQIRLAAVWALGRICLRDSAAVDSAVLGGKIQPLLKDRYPLIRFSAGETLGIITGDTAGIPQRWIPAG